MSGHGPPSDVSPSMLVSFLRQKPRPSKVVDFPVAAAKGTPFEKVRIIVPPSVDTSRAQLAAHERMRDEIKIPITEWKTETAEAIAGDLTAKEVIARMVHGVEEVAPNRYVKHFADSRDVENALADDEIAVLFALCTQVRNELGPRLRILTDAEVDAWIEVLKEGFDPLAYLQSPDLEVLVRGLHRRIVTDRAKSTGSQAPDSLPSNSQDTSESTSTTCATDITSSGEPPERELVGSLRKDVEPLSMEDALARAREMAGKTRASE